MNKAFLQLVAEHISEHYKDSTDRLCVVLPGKRGAVFLKAHLARALRKTSWLPQMISVEDLIAELSGLQIPDETELICHLYESYSECQGEVAESFESFAKWGMLILHDFNEIDRYLADPAQIYENLRDIKEIENWSLGQAELSRQQQRYLSFMSGLGVIYRHFSKKMLSAGKAWPGLAYRKAHETDVVAKFGSRYEKILICGFNALTTAESSIFNRLRKSGAAEMIWDADRYYLDDPGQEAGHFLRSNLKISGEQHAIFVNDHFHKEKTIDVIAVPKQTGQAQVVRQCLTDLHQKGIGFDKVAVVLATEKLLSPVLQQLPPEVRHLNITMEYPLRFTASYDLIESVLHLQHSYARQNRKVKTLYHKDFSQLLRQPLFQHYLSVSGAAKTANDYLKTISQRNLAFLNPDMLASLLETDWHMVSDILLPQQSADLLATLTKMVRTILEAGREGSSGDRLQMEFEHLSVLLKNFNRLEEIMKTYPHFKELSAFRQLFVQVTGSASVPFLGEPLQGLQIMGVLETRTLDFEHLILVNVNEGLLPSGRSGNSFIPNDLKQANGLPLYTEKDAVYAYHFYRLIQRAKTVTITYDSETDAFGKGEKSRFVTQLQLEVRKYNPEIKFTEKVALFPGTQTNLKAAMSVLKDDSSLKNIIAKAIDTEKYGALSPSGLIMFKKCALSFYLRYGARIKEADEVEEDPEAGTFGSILHGSLEELYKPFAGLEITAGVPGKLRSEINTVTEKVFRQIAGKEELSGKSLLQLEVLRVYVGKLLSQDESFISNLSPRHLSLLYLEHEFSAPLRLAGTVPAEVFIRGKIDRVDRYGDIVRIIDYKSAIQTKDKFVFTGFDALFQDSGFDKQLQLFIYAWLLWKNNVAAPRQLRPAIIPFKEFRDPLILLGENKQPLVFTEELLREFEEALSVFVSQIFNREKPFQQTDDRTVCEFCAYNIVCHTQP